LLIKGIYQKVVFLILNIKLFDLEWFMKISFINLSNNLNSNYQEYLILKFE
jgi:hypothetical protein